MFYSKSTNGFYSGEIQSGDIPADAVYITDEDRRALLDGQSRGKLIVADAEGRPVLCDRPASTDEAMATAARDKRDRLIAETDYLLMPDYPVDSATLDAIKAYRQVLRDIPAQPGFPRLIDWPVMP